MIVPSLVLAVSYAILVIFYFSSAHGYSPSMTTSRRSFINSAIVAGAASPLVASAAGSDPYVPNVEDVKVIATLGITLDKLAAKVGDSSQWGEASSNLAQFAKDPNFYPKYALNYVSKTVKVRKRSVRNEVAFTEVRGKHCCCC